jgi:hypothetical protein
MSTPTHCMPAHTRCMSTPTHRMPTHTHYIPTHTHCPQSAPFPLHMPLPCHVTAAAKTQRSVAILALRTAALLSLRATSPPLETGASMQAADWGGGRVCAVQYSASACYAVCVHAPSMGVNTCKCACFLRTGIPESAWRVIRGWCRFRGLDDAHAAVCVGCLLYNPSLVYRGKLDGRFRWLLFLVPQEATSRPTAARFGCTQRHLTIHHRRLSPWSWPAGQCVCMYAPAPTFQ